jgi:thiol:disulfide interchange protein DsbC
MHKPIWRTLLLAAFTVCVGTAVAQEATIRKNLSQRLPSLPAIDSVTPTPMKGLYEVRINGTELMYSDANGDFVLLQGDLFDTRQRVNLTEARLNQLTSIAFKDLPLKDAITTVRGNGSRKIAVFSDPNCGFCKRLERDLVKLNDVTVYTFVVAMLGPDSQTKAKNIVCAKNPSEAYNAWMLEGQTPPTMSCDTAALTRNLAFAQKHRISGTPTSFLADGTRIAGADMKAIERGLAAQK